LIEFGSVTTRAWSRRGCVTHRTEILLKACLMSSSALASGGRTAQPEFCLDFGPCRDLAAECVWMLYSVDSVDSRCGATLDSQVDCQDGVAVPTKVCKLIEARRGGYRSSCGSNFWIGFMPVNRSGRRCASFASLLIRCGAHQDRRRVVGGA
jgi:hypothetical protein